MGVVLSLLLQHVRAQVVEDLCSNDAGAVLRAGRVTERVAAFGGLQPAKEVVTLHRSFDWVPVAWAAGKHSLVWHPGTGLQHSLEDVLGVQIDVRYDVSPQPGEELRRGEFREEAHGAVVDRHVQLQDEASSNREWQCRVPLDVGYPV